MPFIDRLFGLFTGRKAAAGSADGTVLAPMYGGGSWFGERGITQDKLMTEARGWVYACISHIAEEIGSAKLRLYRMSGGERKQWEEIEDHPLLDLLDAPNPHMPRVELFQTFSMHEDMTGNAYWLLDGVEKTTDKPVAILPLNPRYVKPKITRLPAFIAGYEYTVQSEKKTFTPEQIIHFRRPNPDNPYIGLGPLEAVADAVDSDNWAREYNRRLFQNSGFPGLILSTDTTDPTTINMLRDSFEDRHAGASKAHKTAVLPPGVTVVEKGMAQRDMDFVELRRFARDEILAHFGVPAVILGLGLGETINRASAETLTYVYMQNTIRPKLRRFEMFLNEYLTPRFGPDLILEFDDPVPDNIEQRLSVYRTALGNAPYMSVNEIRDQEGLSPVTGGDVVMGSALNVPVGSPKKAAPAPAAKEEKPAKVKQAGHFAKSLKKRSELKDALSAAVTDAIRKSVDELKNEDWETRWDAFVKRVTPHETEFRDAMRQYAFGMAKRAQENLRNAIKGETQKALHINRLLDEKQEVGAIITLTKGIYEKITKTEGQTAADMVGTAFDETDERVTNALKHGMDLMTKNYHAETTAILESKLQAALDDGLGIEDMTRVIQEVGDFSAAVRAERVARTESFRTANMATKEAWNQSGVVKTIKWYVAGADACALCAPLNGETVGIDENFFDKGDTVRGSDGSRITLDYDDVGNPPLHVNCRCYVRPDEISID